MPEGLPGAEPTSLVELMRMTREEGDVEGRRSGGRGMWAALENWAASVDEPLEEAMAALRDVLDDTSRGGLHRTRSCENASMILEV